MKTNNTLTSNTIVFVTGAFVSHHGWADWQTYFEQQGYKTFAPSWPGKEGTAEELRAQHPHINRLADLTISDLVDHYAGFIGKLPEKPILIGHSFGGLISQILLNRGLADGAIVLHSVPPLGVIPYEWSFLKSTWGALGLFTPLKETYLMPFETWQYAFTNGMSLEDQKKAYEENTIPESKRVTRGGLTLAARVDFKKEHKPLLMIAGANDNIIPASLNKRNFKHYSNKNSVADFKEFPNNHFVVGLPNWKETAAYASAWINKHRVETPTPSLA